MDLHGIPEDDFNKLASYLGEEEAYEYIKKKRFNYQSVATKLLVLGVKEYLKKKPLFYTIVFVIIIIIFLLILYEDLIFF